MITIGDFYYFPRPDAVWLVTAISDRVYMTCLFDHSETSILPKYVELYGRYLGNTSTLPASQLKDFYPELFI